MGSTDRGPDADAQTRTRAGGLQMARQRWWLRIGALTAAFALLAAGCGDDGDGGAATPEPSDTTGADTAEPQRGGELTMLFHAEIGSLDPIRSTGSGGSDAQQMFAFYGALFTLNPETVELEMLLAESFEPNADSTVWTL